MILLTQQPYLKALANAHKRDLIVAAGSFFLAGELREAWISEQRILQKRSALS